MAYFDKYGVEFSDDRKTLVKCPEGFQGRYVIPEGVKGIGKSAFSLCPNLTSIVIPNSVTTIGDDAFYHCSGLTSIDIPNSVTCIGDHAFYHCSALRSVTIPSSIMSIGIGAFFSCHSLASIEVANDNPNYSSIDGVLFDKQQTMLIQCPCGKQGAYTIPNSVTSIEEGAFDECRRLTSVTIPNSVTSIGVGAFINCCSLTSVKIPKSVASIGFGAFSSCHSLTSIEVANDDPNYSSIDGVLFNKQQTVLIQCPCGKQGAYTIPNGVTSIEDSAFSGCRNLTSVTIPNSVTSIEECAFFECRRLTSVTIPNSVASIGMGAFSRCRSLTSVTLNSSAIVCKNYVSSRDLTFEDGYGIKDIFDEFVTEIIIGHEITSIGSGAFKDCSSLTSVTIPNSVTSIGDYAFSGCKVTSINFIGTLDNWCNKAWAPSQIASQYKLLINGVLQDNVKIPNSVTSIGSWAFKDCSSLTSVAIPNSVTNIGRSAFSGCSSFTSMMIGNSVISIGDYAFYECSSLTSVTIPNGVTSIGSGAFSSCSSLASVTIGNSVTHLGRSAFSGCRCLTSVTIGNSVTSIGDEAFSGCSSLTSLTIPNSVTNIECRAFSRCSSLISVTIGNSVTSIGHTAFFGCSSLTSVTIPNSVVFIGMDAFSGCSSLPVIDNLRYADTYLVEAVDKTLSSCSIKQGTKWILFGALEDCRRLTSVTIPGSVTNIGENAFRGCSSLTSMMIPGSVTNIGESAFSGCRSLTSIEIPNSVTSIEEGALSSCRSLTSINVANDNKNYSSIDGVLFNKQQTRLIQCPGRQQGAYVIPNSVTSIEAGAFRGCHSLTSVTIPSSVTSIGWRAFEGCISLKSIEIPNSVTRIGNGTFSGCSSLPVIDNLRYADTYLVEAVDKSLSRYKIKDGTRWIGVNAFGDCHHLASIVIPDSVTSIEESAFKKCRSLTSVTIPNGIKSIKDWTFQNCLSLTSIKIPNSTTCIRWYAFQDCVALTSIEIPNSVTSIQIYAFSGCSSLPVIDNLRYADTYLVEAVDKSLSRYKIKDGTRWIGNSAFSDCHHLTSIVIPNSVTSIEQGAFSSCRSLTSVTIPPSVTSIQIHAFSSCSSLPVIDNLRYADTYLVEAVDKSLSRYKIKDGTRWIGDDAFSDCHHLTSIVIPNSVTNIGFGAFHDCDNLAEIYVPQGQKERFAQMEGLKDINHLIVEKADVALNDRFIIRKLLYNNRITCFYHFTSRKNIDSICQHGGLYSWHYLKTHQIDIPLQGGGELSQGLDRYKGVADYVHLSFCENHPMAYHLIQEGEDIVVLKISTDVALLDGTMFTDMNAVDSQCNCAVGLDGLQKVNFAATKEKYLSKDDSLFKYKQAEILVKTHVPLEYILNIDEFI